MSRKILLTGRAGSGKSRRVLTRAAELLRARRAEECLLFLPIQSQVDHVRGLLLREGIPGFRDDFAHTFFTFCRSLGSDLPGQLLSEEGRDYLLGDLLRVETLPAFAAVRTYPGFRRLLGGALKELKDNGITPETYASQVLDPLRERGPSEPRHRDLGKAFAAYERLLAERGRIDQEDLALRALARLEKEPELLAGRELILADGFHDFTPVQFRIVTLLARRIPESIFTLSFDPAHPESPIFAVSAGTREALLRLGFVEEVLGGNHRTGDATLRHVEEHLFTEAAPRAQALDSIRITRASRQVEEVEAIARAILRLVREEKVPYRDIAVLYHDLSGVADLVEGVFQRFGVPGRLYQPRPLARQPLVRFLLDLGRILARGPDADTLIRWLRSGYVTGLEISEVDRLDANLRKEGPPEDPAGWNSRCRELGLAGLQRVLATLAEAAGRVRGKHGISTLRRVWLEAFSTVALPLGEQGPRGREECAALEVFHRLLEEAGNRVTSGKGNPTLGVLLENVEEGAAEATFRIRDRRREVVNVINAYEARQWEVPYLFVAGVLERQFPPAPMEDLFFTDADRQRLEACGHRFPGRRRRQHEERFLFYNALTRARVRLHLSHHVTDARGNPTLPSFFLREVERLFTTESLSERADVRRSSAALPSPEEIVREEEIDRTICLGLEDRFPAERPSPSVVLAGALYQRRRADPGFRRRLAAALGEPRPELTDAGILRELATRETAFSNSALNSLRQCPYLHFVEKWLGLEAFPERELTPLDSGNLLHAVMKEWLEGKGAEEALSILDRRFEQAAAAKRRRFNHLSELWRLRRAVQGLLRDEDRIRALRRFSPARFEASFGGTPGAEPPVRIQAGGREERLSGRIDRIDLSEDGKAALVVDYKYSRPEAVRKQWKAGAGGADLEDFQLAIYLLAVKEALGLEPAGAELVALKERLERRGILLRTYENHYVLPAELRKNWRVLDEADFDRFLETARNAIGELLKEARSGRIETQPADLRRCGPQSCDAADICRFDRWVGTRGGGEAN